MCHKQPNRAIIGSMSLNFHGGIDSSLKTLNPASDADTEAAHSYARCEGAREGGNY
jgi:hypothetical protein